MVKCGAALGNARQHSARGGFLRARFTRANRARAQEMLNALGTLEMV